MATRLSLAALRSLSSRLPGPASLQFSRAVTTWSTGGCSKRKDGRRCPGCKGKFGVPRAAAALSSQAQPSPAPEAQTTGRYVAPNVCYEGYKIDKAEVDLARGMLVTYWQDGSRTEFPQLWLRDNCQCSTCFYEPAVQRLFVMEDLDLEVHITEVQVRSYKDIFGTLTQIVAFWFKLHWNLFSMIIARTN